MPAGSGVVINSNDYVEVFNNDIQDNNTANLIVSSVYSTNYQSDNAVAGYDPYPEAIYIYDNNFSGGGDSPDGLALKALKTAMFGGTGSFPDVLWDGYFNTEKYPEGVLNGDQRICINNGDTGILNADQPGGNKKPSTDISQHKCDLEKLPAIKLSTNF